MNNESSVEVSKEKQAELLRFALKIGAEFNRKLDFSDTSIGAVEEILGEVHREFIGKKDEQGLRGIALEFAAYIVRVIETHHGQGAWFRHHASFGADSFPYEWRGTTIFPFIWCMKRLLDGENENVETKYRALVSQRRS